MIAALLGLVASSLVFWLASTKRQNVRRVDELPRRVIHRTAASPSHHGVLESVGDRVFRLPGVRSLSVPSDVRRSTGFAVVVCPTAAVFMPRLALVLAILLIALPVLRHRRRSAARKRAIARDLPMVIDLLHLAIRSGLTVGGALAHVVAVIDGPVAEVYRSGLKQLDQGRRMSEVLTNCESRLGDDAAPLTSALLSSERYGSPLSETLAQLVQETRFDQERQAEQSARRLTVQLLFPVAGCILPAFALLTAAPLLAGSVGTLADSFH
jgi:pilus assembly protein TadC